MNNITNNEDLTLTIDLAGYVNNPAKIKLIDIAIYTDNVYASVRKTHEDFDSLNCVKITSNELSTLNDGVIHYNIQIVEHDGTTFADVVTTQYELCKAEGAESIYDVFVTKEVLDNYVTNDSLNEKGFLTEHQSISHLASKDELNAKADKAELINKLEQKDADKLYQPKGEYLTSHQSLDHLALATDIPTKVSDLKNDAGYISTVPSNYVTEETLNSKGYLTEHQPIDHLATKKEIEGVAKESWVTEQINNKVTGSTSVDLKDYYKKSETYSRTEIDNKGYLTKHQSISHLANKDEIPTHTSQLINDNNFLTAHQPIDHLANKEDVYTKDDIDRKHYITSHQDISYLASKEEIPSLVSQLTNDAGYLSKVPSEYITDLQLSEYAPKAWVSSEIEKNVSGITEVDLSNYYKKYEVYSQDEIDKKHFLTEHQNISHLASKNEIPTRTSQLYNDTNYLTEHQSLANYATLSDVNKKANIDHTHSQYLTNHQDISYKLDKTDAQRLYQPKGYYLTEHQPLKTVNGQSLVGSGNIVIEGGTGGTQVDLSNYYKKSETYSKNEIDSKGYLTTIPANYVTDSELASKGYLTQHQSLADYALKSWVSSEIDSKITGGEVDLSGYYKKNETYSKDEIDGKGYLTSHQSLTEYAKKTDIPKDYVTEETLNSKGYLTSHQSIDHLATKAELSDYQLAGDYVTNSELLQKGYLTEHQSIDHLATKAELDTYQPKGNYVTNEVLDGKGYLTDGSLVGYAKEEWVNTQIDSKLTGGTEVDLTNYYKKNETYSQQEIDSKGYLTSIPSNYVTDEKLAEKGYLTEHQSLADYALKSELPSTESFATTEQLNGKVDTTTYTQDKSTFATKSELGTKAEQSAVDLKADKTELNNKVDVSAYTADKSTFASKEELSTKVESIELTQKEYDALSTKDSNILYVITDAPEVATKGDLANLATKEELNAKADSTWVTEQINAAIANVNVKINEISNKIGG